MSEKLATNSRAGGLFGLIIFGLFVWWGYNQFIKTDYSKPWWTGTEQVRLCKVPYYDSSACNYVSATSDGERITSITVSGQVFPIYDSECFEAASTESNDRFCRLSESGQRYDLLPG